MAADLYVTHVCASLPRSREHLYSSVFVELNKLCLKFKNKVNCFRVSHTGIPTDYFLLKELLFYSQHMKPVLLPVKRCTDLKGKPKPHFTHY